MKKTIIAIALITSSFIALDDILSRTGTNETAIHKSIIQAALTLPEDNAIPNYNASGNDFGTAYKATKAIVLNERGSVVKEMCTYFKNYYNSPQFKTDFAEALKVYDPGETPKDSAYWQHYYDTAYKTTVNAYDGFNTNFDRDKVKDRANASLSNSQSALDMAQKMLKEHPELAAKAGMTQEQLMEKMQQAQAGINTGKTQSATAIDENMTDSKVAATKAEAAKNYNEALVKLKTDLQENLKNVPVKRKEYNDKLALYKKKSNYKANISATLQHFLSLTEGIDFTAELKNNKTFANAQYENKNNLWKACFRAGKDATDAARSFAQSWMAELK